MGCKPWLKAFDFSLAGDYELPWNFHVKAGLEYLYISNTRYRSLMTPSGNGIFLPEQDSIGNYESDLPDAPSHIFFMIAGISYEYILFDKLIISPEFYTGRGSAN